MSAISMGGQGSFSHLTVQSDASSRARHSAVSFDI